MRAATSAEPQRAVPDDRQPLTPTDGAVPRVARVASSEVVAGRRTHPAAHILFAPGDARRAGMSDSGAGRTSGIGITQRYMHLSPAALDSAIRLLNHTGPEGGHYVRAVSLQSSGDILETGSVSEGKING